jgi:hypothetical protein
MMTSASQVLRLESCADSLIGNELIKGISGGEKRCGSLLEIYIYIYKFYELIKASPAARSGAGPCSQNSLLVLPPTRLHICLPAYLSASLSDCFSVSR